MLRKFLMRANTASKWVLDLYSRLPIWVTLTAIFAVGLIAFVAWEATKITTFSWKWIKAFRMPSLPWMWIGIGLLGTLILAAIIVAIVRYRRRSRATPAGSPAPARRQGDGPVKKAGKGLLGFTWRLVLPVLIAVWLFFSLVRLEGGSDWRAVRKMLGGGPTPEEQRKQSLIASIRESGIVLPERDVSFLYTVRPGFRASFVEPKGYCTHTEPVRKNEAYVFVSSYGRIVDSPLSNDNHVPGLVGYFQLEPYGSQRTVVKVTSYACG